ncbi:unnamed protein product [Phytophthora fragariaefolia]|uniref:Unnamed protein product n=1 Tax=Phytophthora fragariaefolia TaxID=1490495 RepID=A0A9W6X8C5_9STRA|nr:unnamed protein product [Phytophthora fragariaefolia]
MDNINRAGAKLSADDMRRSSDGRDLEGHGDVPKAYDKADKEAEVEIFLFVPGALEISDDILPSLGTLLKFGYTQCYTDSCLYYKHDAGGTTLVDVYVDDLLVARSNNERIGQIFKELQCLELKDLGVVSKFLGIRFEHGTDGWAMDPAQTIREIVEKAGLRDANPVKVPIGTDQEEGDDTLLPSGRSGTSGLLTVQLFQSLVRSLSWVPR